MTDRELLELAAKAAGIDACRLPDAWPVRCADPEDEWSPLIDDGDALRLAVQMCLVLDIQDEQTRVDYLEIEVAHEGDPQGATRRAIVLAAAEMGKTMA